MSFSDPAAFLTQLLLMIPGFLLAITVHEFSHGITADRLGDDTPRRSGRLTLNPLRHIDPLGVVAFVVAGFGWARPVPVSAQHLRSPVRDMALIAAAGPLANFATALVTLLGFVLVARAGPTTLVGALLQDTLRQAYRFNLLLGVFNLLPVPPLDGGHFLRYFLPRSTWDSIARVEQYGPILLIVLVVSGVAGRVVRPVYVVLHEILTTLVGGLL